jgi:glucose 1-dehydrogenase
MKRPKSKSRAGLITGLNERGDHSPAANRNRFGGLDASSNVETASPSKKLKGRVAIVTGAGRGIGVAIAQGLALEGAAVIVNFSRSAKEAEDVARFIKEKGGKAVAVRADVKELEAHEVLIRAAIEHFGRLDILVNNAGIEFREPFLSTSLEQWEATLGVNLKSAYFLSQKAAQVMIKAGRGGKIINISSVHDTVPLVNRSAYAVSKGGLAMLTKSLALELAEHKINVNAISPGAILTEMNQEQLSKSEVRARLLARIPSNRLGTTQDCVGAAIYLASCDSDYVTGATIYVDGGLLLRRL